MVFLTRFRTYIPVLILLSGISSNAWSQTVDNKKNVCIPSAEGKGWSCAHGMVIPEIYSGAGDFSSTEQAKIMVAEAAISTTTVTSNTQETIYSDITIPETTRSKKVAGCPAATLTKFKNPPDDKTLINADHTEGSTEEFILTGNVELTKGGNSLTADKIIYNKPKDRADATGNVVFRQKDMQISGESGFMQIEGEKAEFNATDYEILNRNARGKAKIIKVESPTSVKLNEVTYTTCATAKKDWQLKAEKVDLNREEGHGEARSVIVEFMDIPVFYTPYISFPIDGRRKSGFLPPSFGDSSESGADASIPYYWNISPNRDATITPRILEKRGLQIAGEYRYLHENSNGKLGAEILPNDDRYNDDRYLATYQHRNHFRKHWSTDVDLSHASDRDYFEDLGDSLSLASTTNLERRADLRYDRENWSLLARAQGFQPLDTTSETYRRLPQILFSGEIPSKAYPLTYHLHGEYVRFDHKDNVTVGNRLDIYPGISYDLRSPAYYVTPKLSVRHTSYALDNPGAGKPDDPSRTTPIFSLDSGLFFERDSDWGANGMVQTLEPRLYYLYAKNKDQSNFPVFDTSALDFSFGQLFRENRYSGADRQGDANQLTLALTSRLLEKKEGYEKVRASIGAIYYLDDRKVTLPGESIATTNSSSLVTNITAHLNRMTYISADLQWAPQNEKTEQSAIRFHYQSKNDHIFNVAYRYRLASGTTEGLEQTDLSVLWPISSQWTAIARWNYSLPDERSLESFAGLQYETCCWSVRLVGRKYANGTTSQDNTAIYLTLTLKGLTSIGNNLDGLLENGILGYRDIAQ